MIYYTGISIICKTKRVSLTLSQMYIQLLGDGRITLSANRTNEEIFGVRIFPAQLRNPLRDD